jgi:hypothetical protein
MIPPVFDAADRASLTCIQAAEQGQAARQSNDLLGARTLFAQCAAPQCPAVVRRDCGAWLEDATRQTPSVVLGARDAQGRDMLDAVASIDGVVVARRLDGSPIEINPGPHSVRVEVSGAPAATLDVVVRAGEKNRTIVLSLVRPAAPPLAVSPAPAPLPAPGPGPAAPRDSVGHGVPLGAWLLGGVALAALGVFTTFAIIGKNDADSLRGSCAPGCSPGDVSAVRTKLLIADVALGAAAVSAAGATWIAIRF